MRIPSIAALLLVLALAGCAGQPETDDETGGGAPAPAQPSAPDDDTGAGFGVPEQEGPGVMDELTPDASDDPLLSERVIYFDFDRDEVRDEFRDILRAHADFLQESSQRRVRLEGHTDERGSREYNIGLGERRALSVRDFLMLQGVSASQITTVSYGEERPAALGSNEEAWAQNRRVELVYRE